MKDFDAWNERKKQIDALGRFQHPKEREIWWCRIGMNVGTEIYGKGKDYERPVLVINAEGEQSCIVIPITSKIRAKKYSCLIQTQDGTIHSALLFQIKNADKRRFRRKMYVLSEQEYRKVRTYFEKLYKI